MATFTKKEAEALTKFRPLVADLNLNEELSSDHQLIRWLRARDLNVQKANEMLRKALQWRKENNIDDIASWKPPANFEKQLPYDLEGFDKDGAPLVFIPWGKWNMRKLVEGGQTEEYLRFVDYIMDQSDTIMRETNKSRDPNNPVTQVSLVCDMTGFSMMQIAHKATVDCMLEDVKKMEAMYPEIMKTYYMINSPKVFTILYALMKPFLSKQTLENVQIFGSDPKKWGPGLLKLANQDQIPTIYGGTRALKKNYLEILGAGSGDDADEDAMCEVSVKGGEATNVVLDVKHAGSTLSWTFRTDEAAIGFALLFDGGEELIPHEKVDSHSKKQEGTHMCTKPGRYTFVFDNTKGKSITLHYIVSVSSTEDSDEE